MSTELIPVFLAWYVVFVFSTTLHEAMHALAAQRLGDNTAYLGGQVTLNPLPHIQREPFGMLLVPLLSFFFLYQGRWLIGWASAPYDPNWAMRYPRRAAIMAFAGPLGNLGLLLLAGIALRIGLMAGWFVPGGGPLADMVVAANPAAPIAGGLATLLSILFGLNLVLFVFNLLPLPPLDGSAMLQLALSDSMARRYQELLRYPMWNIVGLLVAWRIFSVVFAPVYNMSVGLLMAGLYGGP